MDLTKYVREIPDFPKEGILFRDISPLLRHPPAWEFVLHHLDAFALKCKADVVVGIEARGFIVGGALAFKRGIGFVPLRKPGKLPGKVYEVSYSLEYGTDRLEMLQDSLQRDQKVLIVDDLLATGGTVNAAIELVQKADVEIVGCAFIVELFGLGGRRKIPNEFPVETLINYE